MTSVPPPKTLLDELESHAHSGSLVAAVRHHAFGAARARNAKLVTAGRSGGDTTSGPPSQLIGIDDGELATPSGNLLEVLNRGPQSAGERALLGALLALAIRTDAEPATLAPDTVWLATHTPCDALPYVDEALADRAEGFWKAVAKLAAAPSEHGHGRAETLVAAAALGSSGSSAARLALADLDVSDDPAIASLVAAGSDGGAAPEALSGELVPRPYGPVGTALLALTLVLFALRLGRVIGKLAFSYRCPAFVRLTGRGLELEYRTELLGKVLRDRSTLVPISNLARVTREIRYGRAGMYVGLLALVLGSYFGMGLLVDGLRVPGSSPPLLGLAITLIVLGVLIDFALSSLSDGARGRCRVVVVPIKGRTLCVGGLDPSQADQMLARIAQRVGQ